MLSHLSETLVHHRGFCGTFGSWKHLSKCIIIQCHTAESTSCSAYNELRNNTTPFLPLSRELSHTDHAGKPSPSTRSGKTALAASGESITNLRDTS